MKLIALIAILLAFLATSAFASTTKPTLSTTAAHVGDTLTVSGCGYKQGYDISVYLYRSGETTALYGFATHPDARGCFTAATGYTFTTAGGYEAYSYQHKDTGVGSYNQNHPLVDMDFVIS